MPQPTHIGAGRAGFEHVVNNHSWPSGTDKQLMKNLLAHN
jgi:hypothetical protein